MNHFIEIRSYTLKPGTPDEFHSLFLEEAMPLLQRWHVTGVAYGPSWHDENSYYLPRRLDSLAHPEENKNDFWVATNGEKVRVKRSWLASRITAKWCSRWMKLRYGGREIGTRIVSSGKFLWQH